jgi:uncharacterized protein (TIGR03437 family)
MQLIRPPQARRGLKWRIDTPFVASCIILLAHSASFAAPRPFSTFLKENTAILSVGHDAAGNLYTFSVTVGGTYAITRLDAIASKVTYSVSTSSLGCESSNAMAIDPLGNVFIAGSTSALGQGYPCVLKFDPSGKLVYSFVIERGALADAQAIAVDADGSVLITGLAYEFGFPSAGGGFSAPTSSLANYLVLQPFVARIDPAGSKLLSSAVGVGGSRIQIGPRGDIFVAGGAAGMAVGSSNMPSNSYPITPGAFQTTFTPSFDCTGGLCQVQIPSSEQYVTRLDSALSKLIYSTYVTGSHGATNYALAVDSSGNAYLTGLTHSSDYPYTVAQPTTPRPGAFLTKVDPTGSKLIWSVQQGGNLLAFDSTGNLILGGSALPAPGLPNSDPPYPTPPPPPAGDVPAACLPIGLRVQIAAFVQRLNSLDGRVLATQLLSATRAQPSALDVLPDGRILVGGASTFPDIPITPGTIFSTAIAQRTPSGAFLAAFDLATPSLGGALSCAADGLTDLPVGPLAPGQLLSLFGNGLGPDQPVTASISGPSPVPVSLGGVTVMFDDVAAPLTYVSSGQINVGVPWEISGRSSTIMTVSVNGSPVTSREFVVARSTPALFVDTSGPVSDGDSFFPAIALNNDGTRNSSANPAPAGSLVTMFLNGAAAYAGSIPPATGSITGPNPDPVGIPAVVTAGTAALESGPLTPWPGVLSGVYQIQVRMPGSSQNGPRAIPLTVTVGGVPAAPFVYFDKVYQAGGLVWVN